MLWNFGNNLMGWGFGFGGIFMLLFWGLVIWAVFVLARGVSGQGCHGHNCGGHQRGESNALEILKERYAKGEISKKEFDEVKKDLER